MAGTSGKPGTKLDRRQRANLLFFLWALVIVGFFSFSTRQEYYTIPALPGMALLVGGWLARESGPAARESDRRAGRISSTALFAFGVLAFVAGMYLLFVSHRPVPGADLADLLKKNPQEYNLSLGHVLDLTPQALGAFRGPLLGASFGLFLGTGLNWILRRRGRPFAGNVALAAMMVVLLACVHSSFSTFSPILSSYNLAEAIRKQFRPGDVIVIDGEYHEASTLNFYTGIQVHVLHEPSGNLWYGAKFPDAPHIFETPESLAVLWNGPGGGVPVDGPGRTKRTAWPEVFPVGAQRRKIHIHESRPKAMIAGATRAAAHLIRTGSGKMTVAVLLHHPSITTERLRKRYFPSLSPAYCSRSAGVLIAYIILGVAIARDHHFDDCFHSCPFRSDRIPAHCCSGSETYTKICRPCCRSPF